jgi:hypothetical protein
MVIRWRDRACDPACRLQTLPAVSSCHCHCANADDCSRSDADFTVLDRHACRSNPATRLDRHGCRTVSAADFGRSVSNTRKRSRLLAGRLSRRCA